MPAARSARCSDPLLWLVGFAVVDANAGEDVTVTITVRARAFQHWSAAAGGWTIEPGAFQLAAGASSLEWLLFSPIEIFRGETSREGHVCPPPDLSSARRTPGLSTPSMNRNASNSQHGSPVWWRSAVIYQVYIRSFADGNGDGIGDIPGLHSRLPYFAGLGVDALWISPWYPSPMKDAGYDVSDYRGIEPVFGTLADAAG